MGPKGVYNTLHTAFGGTKKDWEAEKAAEREREKRDWELRQQQYRQNHPEEYAANKEGRDAAQTGPAMSAPHDPNDAYQATQKNVKNAIMSVSSQPGARIAQQQLHKQAAQQFAKSKGINVERFMELSPEVQKDVMASDDPMAVLREYNTRPNYWTQQ